MKRGVRLLLRPVSYTHLDVYKRQDNDYEMVAHAGVGVAMGNAKETIQKAARIITASNTQSGVSLIPVSYTHLLGTPG